MVDTTWLRQTKDKPLFPDLLWSKPENRQYAGKLLVVGGNLHSFAAPATAYMAAQKAGAGVVRALLPDVTKKILGQRFFEAEFGASSPSGSFSQKAYLDLMEHAEWADSVLLAGDFGRNSETAILLDKFAREYKGQLVVAQDALDYFLVTNSIFFSRPNTTAVINLGKLQKVAKQNHPATPIRHSMSLHELVKTLGQWTQGQEFCFVTRHADNLVAAAGGQASTTPYEEDLKWQTELPAYIAVWLMQQPDKVLESLITAVWDYTNN
jgi:hypothetical protein